MKKVFFYFLVIFFTTKSQAQKSINFQSYFEKAYANYPKVPKGSLEALAYVQSRIQNLIPEKDMDHHHGPNRYGVFALIEDGEGYFKNTLLDLSNEAKVAVNDLKTNVSVQINAVAKKIENYCVQNNVSTIEGMANCFKAFSEIPNKTSIDAFAKDQFLYDIYLSLTKGINENNVVVKPIVLDKNKWFSAETFKIVSAPFVKIENEVVTNGTETYKVTNPNAGATTTMAVAAVTDYPPALWVASPNFSSRGGVAISAVTIHTMQGSYSGSISWFQNTASQVSAHYNIRSSDGQITQMVRESNKAWHVGNNNPFTIGIEHEGFVNNASWYTTAMYNASAALTIDICNDNNIDKTTCYNGVAHTGTVLLSTAIKIKGHQHFANQSHVDPGINWNWSLYYNLINPPAPCNTPTSLTTTNITANSAKLNWTTVTGANTYTIEYKTSASSTYTAVSGITTNTYTLSSLAGATTYNWRVKTNCATNSSALATAINFNTLNPCLATTVLNESYIGTSSVNLNWTAVAGATGYILEWKPAAATTWTTVNTVNNYTSLFGLAAASSYNWRVSTVCASGNSTASASQTFTTQASCYDAYETNNVYTAPAIYPSLNGGYVYGKICASGDVDFYKITTTATSNINFTLANLPKNYNIETFTSTGAFLKGGYAAGTTSESVVLNNKAAGVYLFKVYGATTLDNDALNDYRLQVTTSAPTVAKTIENVSIGGLQIVPNPAKDYVQLSYENLQIGKNQIVIKDMYGVVKQQQVKSLGIGLQKIEMNVQNLQQGIYIIQISNDKGILYSKQLIITK
jgi:N-acetyl-anhydromuramyl-L-alanine amidase AmpD